MPLGTSSFRASNIPIHERLHSLEAGSTHPSAGSVWPLGVESMAVVPAFNSTGFVVGIQRTMFADTCRTNQAVSVGPLFPSAKLFPDELSVTPILCPPELHLWDFRQCPKV